MEDRFRVLLADALSREGMSALDLARDVGMDKAYFVDFLAGRKKTVSALGFMKVAKRLSLDPWDAVGVERPNSGGVKPPAVVPAVPLPQQTRLAERLRISMVVEEGAFRDKAAMAHSAGLPPSEEFDRARQAIAIVRGGEYAPWGVVPGALLHVVSFERYEAVAPGRTVVVRSSKGDLHAYALRRVSVSVGGELVFEVPPAVQTDDHGGGWCIAGLVVGMSFPSPVAV